MKRHSYMYINAIQTGNILVVTITTLSNCSQICKILHFKHLEVYIFKSRSVNNRCRGPVARSNPPSAAAAFAQAGGGETHTEGWIHLHQLPLLPQGSTLKPVRLSTCKALSERVLIRPLISCYRSGEMRALATCVSVTRAVVEWRQWAPEAIPSRAAWRSARLHASLRRVCNLLPQLAQN